MIKKVLKVGAIVLVLGVASGCASQAAIDAAQATADNAARDAAAAKSAAEAARAAQTARHRQLEVHKALQTRLSAATEAQACCDANRDRLERMFQRSQAK